MAPSVCRGAAASALSVPRPLPALCFTAAAVLLQGGLQGEMQGHLLGSLGASHRRAGLDRPLWTSRPSLRLMEGGQPCLVGMGSLRGGCGVGALGPTLGRGEGRGGLVRMMAAPRKKLPERSVDVCCKNCQAKLYKYKKGNGKNSQLVKCYVERIVDDYTEGDLKCQACGQEFAREANIHGRPAHKIIGGKVFMK